MKQNLIAIIWPALVGVLAATLILDKWVLNNRPVTEAVTASSYREAVARATPSVVNIYTAKLVESRVDPRAIHSGNAASDRIVGTNNALSGHWVPA